MRLPTARWLPLRAAVIGASPDVSLACCACDPSPCPRTPGRRPAQSPTVKTVVGDLVPRRARRPRRRVVLSFTLPADARQLLAERLGSDDDLVDIQVSEGDEDIVMVPSSSRQLTGKLRAAFPDAALFVVELEDLARGVELRGQVLRTLDAGADGYVVARSVDELASIVDQASGRIGRADAAGPAALAAGAPEELSEVLDALLVQRQNRRAPLRHRRSGDDTP